MSSNQQNFFTPAKTPPQFVELKKLSAGDKVAIVSTSAQVVAPFPHVYERGINRIKNIFELEPVEFPHTKIQGSSYQERAQDINAAFADPECKAIISVIGGEEQIKILPYLNAETLRNNPKAFFGYSDNTNLCMYLWSLGIPSYYGGCVMTEYGMSGKLHPYTENFLRLALFESKKVAISASSNFSDQDLSWGEPANLNKEYEFENNEGWYWDGSQHACGILWGGCTEILGLQLQTNKWLPDPAAIKNSILCLETSEEMPSAWFVFCVIHALGERGYLKELSGLIVGRPKAQHIFNKIPSAQERAKFRADQRATIIKEFRNYNQNAPIVQNFDFGHTKPQIPMPFGRIAEINADSKEVFLQF